MREFFESNNARALLIEEMNNYTLVLMSYSNCEPDIYYVDPNINLLEKIGDILESIFKESVTALNTFWQNA